MKICIVAALVALLLGAAPVLADPANSIPEQAVCRACELRGAGHGLEDVATWREQDGEMYYFCSEPCGEAFDAFPLAYLRLPLPRPAPPVSVTQLDGTALNLGDLEGELFLLDFWATWCQPCVKGIPELRKLGDEYADQGLRVVGISIDEKGLDHVRKFAKKKDMTYDVVLDNGEAPAWVAYGVAAVPTAFLVDREQRIVAEWKGFTDSDAVRSAVETHLGVTP
ncbi:MAG: hypothetical protein DHS20C21_14170 [Gemmatimonadota bacterium]|nr:MAG: hypothetical protein DHS20C21_14170 [Gemmatimonadota bacterium]